MYHADLEEELVAATQARDDAARDLRAAHDKV